MIVEKYHGTDLLIIQLPWDGPMEHMGWSQGGLGDGAGRT